MGWAGWSRSRSGEREGGISTSPGVTTTKESGGLSFREEEWSKPPTPKLICCSNGLKILSDWNGIDWVRTACASTTSSSIDSCPINSDSSGTCLAFVSQTNSMLLVIYRPPSSSILLLGKKIWHCMAFSNFTIGICLKVSRVKKWSRFCCPRPETYHTWVLSNSGRSLKGIFIANLSVRKHSLELRIATFGSWSPLSWIEGEESLFLTVSNSFSSWFGSIIRDRVLRIIKIAKESHKNLKSQPLRLMWWLLLMIKCSQLHLTT